MVLDMGRKRAKQELRNDLKGLGSFGPTSGSDKIGPKDVNHLGRMQRGSYSVKGRASEF